MRRLKMDVSSCVLEKKHILMVTIQPRKQDRKKSRRPWPSSYS